jgi:beta-galactosidase
VKTVYVAATHCDQVELFLNGRSLGRATKPTIFGYLCRSGQRAPTAGGGGHGLCLRLPERRVRPGHAQGRGDQGRAPPSRRRSSRPPEPPAALRLTVHAGPQRPAGRRFRRGPGRFRAVDAQGNRCPTDEARSTFAIERPRGLARRRQQRACSIRRTISISSTECGINRVALRSTLSPSAARRRPSRDSSRRPFTDRQWGRPASPSGLSPRCRSFPRARYRARCRPRRRSSQMRHPRWGARGRRG